MTSTPPADRDSRRLTAAIRLLLRRYAAQLRRHPAMTAGALLLPAAGDILTLYAPPLVIARLLGSFARDEELTASELAPYVLLFAGMWLAGQALWRLAVACIARVEIYGIHALYLD